MTVEIFTLVPLLRGVEHARIEYDFVIFRNQSKNYPIAGVSDEMVLLLYRNGKMSGWIVVFSLRCYMRNYSLLRIVMGKPVDILRLGEFP